MADIIGRVAAVSTSDRKGMPKENVPFATLIAAHGMAGDVHAGSGHRQVSLLALESIEKIRQLGADVNPGSFAENITTAGVDLFGLTLGDRLQIGKAELLVTQLGKECHQRCAIYYAAGDCAMPREGVFARVVTGGLVRPGDAVTVHRCVTLPESDERQGT